MKNKTSVSLVVALFAASLIGTGCASSSNDQQLSSTQTEVSLSHSNYKMVQAGAEGRSYGFRLFLGIIPIAAPSTAAARADLYRNLDQSVNGRSVALINTVEEHSTTWLLLFSVPKIVLTGDVVEFTQDNNASAQPVQQPGAMQ